VHYRDRLMDLARSKMTDRRWWPAWLLAGCVALSPAYADGPQHDFLLLPSVDTLNTFDESEPAVEDELQRASANLLYSYTGGSFRFLGEYLLSNTETELERAQLGWRANDNTMLWLGRFHNTAKFWTTEYHHGQYMMTSITRPSVEEWEDQSGPVPSHVTGMQLEITAPAGDQKAWSYGFSTGLAPKFVDDRLSPFDVLDPESGYGMSFNARIGYRPDMFNNNQVGLVIGSNDINVDSGSNSNLAELHDIRQLTVGVFADWTWDAWRVIFDHLQFRQDLRYTADDVRDEFVAGYLQVEYEASEKWTVFGRIDYSEGEDDSPYLRLLPAFVSHRHMAGLRWDFMPKHALTMELAETATQGEFFEHGFFKEIRFQWSAVYP